MNLSALIELFYPSTYPNLQSSFTVYYLSHFAALLYQGSFLHNVSDVISIISNYINDINLISFFFTQPN